MRVGDNRTLPITLCWMEMTPKLVLRELLIFITGSASESLLTLMSLCFAACDSLGNHQYTYEMDFAFTGACTESPGPCTGDSASQCPGAYLGSATTGGAPTQCLADGVGVSSVELMLCLDAGTVLIPTLSFVLTDHYHLLLSREIDIPLSSPPMRKSGEGFQTVVWMESQNSRRSKSKES